MSHSLPSQSIMNFKHKIENIVPREKKEIIVRTLLISIFSMKIIAFKIRTVNSATLYNNLYFKFTFLYRY